MTTFQSNIQSNGIDMFNHIHASHLGLGLCEGPCTAVHMAGIRRWEQPRQRAMSLERVRYTSLYL